MDTEPTTVIFRADRKNGEVLALFPEIPADSQGNITMYVHVGQHGAADYQTAMKTTRPAKLKEYASLLKELQQIGYKLNIRSRRPSWRKRRQP
jgi:hypothetical protein